MRILDRDWKMLLPICLGVRRKQSRDCLRDKHFRQGGTAGAKALRWAWLGMSERQGGGWSRWRGEWEEECEVEGGQEQICRVLGLRWESLRVVSKGETGSSHVTHSPAPRAPNNPLCDI